MSFTYDPTIDAGKVRLLISDTNTLDPSRQIFSDDEIDAFMALESNVFYAAANALTAIAGNEAQVLKVIKSLDLQTDGEATTAGILAVAKEYRARGDIYAGPDAGFAIAEFVETTFQWDEKVFKELLRTGL